MLYIPPRSTLHHTVLTGLLEPIVSVLIHVTVHPSAAFFLQSTLAPGMCGTARLRIVIRSSFKREKIKYIRNKLDLQVNETKQLTTIS